jgi:hypothetical protein
MEYVIKRTKPKRTVLKTEKEVVNGSDKDDAS